MFFTSLYSGTHCPSFCTYYTIVPAICQYLFEKNKKIFICVRKNKRRFCPPFNSFRSSTSSRPNTLHSIECLYNCIHQVATLFFSSGLLLFPSKSPRLLLCYFPQGKSKNRSAFNCSYYCVFNLSFFHFSLPLFSCSGLSLSPLLLYHSLGDLSRGF